ncbi:MAG: hypothetical protein KGJ66_12600 [Alphaproteobacteria bacterium]|nr:hypothetical protein [Alphaproteobacteria bacterium]
MGSRVRLPPGSPVLHIGFGRELSPADSSARRDAMVIEVRDTGIGMAAEDIPAALAPFEQLDNRFARKYQGTGLGLPLTKHLVELLGGRFSITSVLNRGTTVEIELDCLRRAA